jgi:hypothetical protein
MATDMKAALAIFLILLLAVPMVLPQEEFCSEGDCCKTPSANCYYNCSCLVSFSALPASSLDFSIVVSDNSTDLAMSADVTFPGYVPLPDLPPRHA